MSENKAIVKSKIFIKFVLTKGEITVDEEQAKKILQSEAQLIPIRDENEVWTYETINKAYIIRTEKDYEKMRWWNVEQEKIRQQKLAKEEADRIAKLTPEEKAEIERKEQESRKKMREMFDSLHNSFKIGNK